MPLNRRLVVLLFVGIITIFCRVTWPLFRVGPDSDAPPYESYRKQLSSVLPKDHLKHSRTLFPLPSPSDKAAIYVISLARRTDRRAVLAKLADALELDFTYLDATDAADTSPGGGGELIDRIMERVGWQRWRRLDERVLVGDELEAAFHPPGYDETSHDMVVLHAFPFAWSDEVGKSVEGIGADGGGDTEGQIPQRWAGADYWDISVPSAEEWAQRFPIRQGEALPRTGPKWRTHLHSSAIKDAVRKDEALRRQAVACWHSHVRILRDIVQKDLAAALIMEDDVDIDFTIEHTLATQLPHLPADWDILYLGHCHSQEYTHPPVPHAPRFRQTYHTLCNHGYAVSRKGARKLLRFLRSADYAYGAPVDHAIKDLVQMHYLRSFSAYPPLIIQRKEDVSDIVGQAGLVSSWHAIEGELWDSTLVRVRAYEELHKAEQA